MRILTLLVTFSSIVPIITKDVLTIRRLEKRINGDDHFLSVCLHRPTTNLSNSSEFNLHVSDTITQKRATSISSVHEKCQTFNLSIASLEGQATFLLALYSAGGTDGEVLAEGRATITLRTFDFTTFWIGKKANPVEGQSIRVWHDYSATRREIFNARLVGLNKETSFGCKKSPCYLLEVGNAGRDAQVLLCLSNVAPTDTKACEVCERRLPGHFADGPWLDMPSPDAIELTYSDGGKPYVTVSGTFDDVIKSLDVVFYKGVDTKYHVVSTSCKNPLKGPIRTCNGLSTVDLPGQYKVLLAAVGKYGKVIQSTSLLFENYGIKMRQVTSDLIEVEWKASEEDHYQVSLDRNIPGGYNNVSLYCGGTKIPSCSTYFMRLAQNTYQATLKKKNGRGTQNIVARTITIKKEIREHLKVFNVILDATDRDNRLTNLTVCIEDTIESRKFQLILIDRWGKALRKSGTLEGRDVLCFSEMIIDSSFDTSDKVRILITSEFLFNHFVGDSELYLLNPNQPTGNGIMKVDQVGPRAVRTKWLNVNDAEVTIGQFITLLRSIMKLSSGKIKCHYKEECGKYVYFKNKTASFQFTEFGETLQIVFIKVQMRDIQTINISSRVIKWDRRVEVCFQEVIGASSYGLGLETNFLMIEDNEGSTTMPSGNGRLCLLSEKTIEVGPFSILEIHVTAYDSKGVLLAAGKGFLSLNFISSSQSILGASTMDGIIASWQRLQDLNGKDQYKVTLRALDTTGPRKLKAVDVAAPDWSHKFLVDQEGDYTVCLRATAEIPRSLNGEVCSDVIHVGDDQVLTVPLVETLQVRSISTERVLLNWEPVAGEEVSSYVVTWQLQLFYDYDQYSRDGLYTFPPEMNDLENFRIIQASESSFSLYDLKEESKYVFCVAAVNGSVMGKKTCRMIDLNLHYVLDYPKGIKYHNGIVKWKGKFGSTYQVEWASLGDGKGGHGETQGRSYGLNLKPGIWTIMVRNITDGVASGSSKIHVSVEGIVISYRQVGHSSLVVTWYENREVSQITATLGILLYEVTASKNEESLTSHSVTKCSGRRGHCSLDLIDIEASPGDELSVNILNLNSSISTTMKVQLQSIKKIEALSIEMQDPNHARAVWDKVYEAKRYTYTLYSNISLQEIRLQGDQPGNTLHLNLPNLVGNVFVAQVCIDEDICGECTAITLKESKGNKAAIIWGSTVAGVVIVISFITYFLRRRNAVNRDATDRQNICVDDACSYKSS